MRAVVALVTAFLGGCATLPQVEQTGELGKAISATGKVFREAIVSNKTIALRIGEERQAKSFLEGGKFTLRDMPVSNLDSKPIAIRLRAIKALEEYGDALVLAADQGVIDKLEQSSIKLGAAAGALVSAASPIAAPIAGPALKLGARAVGFLLGNAYAEEILAIVVARNDDVKRVAALLTQDMNVITTLLSGSADDFRVDRERTLEAVRGDDGSVDRLRLYNEYKQARQDTQLIAALAAAALQYQNIFAQLVAAHDAIAKK